MTQAPRRFRPLGLSLAILSCFVLLGFLPLVPALFIGLLALEGHRLVPDSALFWLPPLVGILLMVCAVPAWVGRLPRIRSVFLGVALLALVGSLYQTFSPGRLGYGGGLSGGTLDNTFQNLGLCLVPLRLLAISFTVWYVNRAPARAFYGDNNAEPA